MKKEVVILVAEDDDGHAGLIRKNLSRAGIVNPLVHFKDGQEVIDFLFQTGNGPHRQVGQSYVLLLDIRMPKLDGIEVLRRIKADPNLKRIPVVVLTTSHNEDDISQSYDLHVNCYITKSRNLSQLFKIVKGIEEFWLQTVTLPLE